MDDKTLNALSTTLALFQIQLNASTLCKRNLFDLLRGCHQLTNRGLIDLTVHQ